MSDKMPTFDATFKALRKAGHLNPLRTKSRKMPKQKKAERTYEQWRDETVDIVSRLGPKLYTFDPKWRHQVKQLAKDLSKKFPDFEFVAVPGCLGEWPQISVSSYDEEF